MADPTTYDVEQDQRISTLEGLVTTTYTPPSGSEISFPVVGQAVDDHMWQQMMLAQGNGILDRGGSPYWLMNFDNATDTAKLRVSTTTGDAQAIVRGFYHRMQADITISLPPVSAATTYYVVLEYDPTRHGEPGGPVRVRVVTSLSTASGKVQLALWKVDRKPSQLLTDAVVTQIRPKVAPTITMDGKTQLDSVDATSVLWGTVCVLTHGSDAGRVFRAVGSGGDGPKGWTEVTTQQWVEKNSTPTYTWENAWILRDGKTRYLFGRVRPADGNRFGTTANGFNVHIMAAQDYPSSKSLRAQVVAGAGASAPALAKVSFSGDTIVLYPLSASDYFDFNGLMWVVD